MPSMVKKPDTFSSSTMSIGSIGSFTINSRANKGKTMNKKQKKASLSKLPLYLIVFPLASLFSIALSGVTPAPLSSGWFNYPVACLVVKTHLVLLFAVFILIGWRLLRKQELWLLKYLITTNLLPVYFGGLIFNLISPSLPNLIWIIPLALMYPIVQILPFVNQKLSNSFHKELFAPKTRLGRSLLWVLPIMGFTGVTLSKMTRAFTNGLIGYAAIGILFHFLLVWQSASFAQQFWKQWQEEKGKIIEQQPEHR